MKEKYMKLNKSQINKRYLECKNLAIKKGGLCLSDECKSCTTKMLWQCAEGHQWKATWQNIKNNNSWCPKCFHTNIGKSKRKNIEELQNFAKLKNGRLISNDYINGKTNLIWMCEKQHQWNAKWDNIKNGTWCPYCNNNAKPEYVELKIFANNKGGKLISDIYVNSYSNLIWECKYNHRWEATWHNVKAGNWCPKCASFKTEKICKQLLEKKLNIKFTKTRVYFDNNNAKKFLEFDGYNKENNIAFEYHGIQHYTFPHYFHKTKRDFINMQLRDAFKEQYCAENDIRLIIIPYTEEGNLREYIDDLNILLP